MAAKFNMISYLIRLVAALVLVCATYNPITPYSFYAWAIKPALTDFTHLTVLHGFLGVILLIGWVIFLRATSRSLGFFGIMLAAAFFTMLIWLLIDQGWLSVDKSSTLSWVIIVALSAVLAVGMSWSHIRKRLSGQYDVDETDNE